MGRTIIIGDVHGCSAELADLVEETGFTTGDRLVFVGDLVARGPDSLGVLDIVRRAGALLVRGNHEEKILEWRRERRAHARGGPAPKPLGRLHADVAAALRPVDWSLLSTAPLWLDLPEHGMRVVHAGVLPGVPIEEQRKKTLLHVRTLGANGEPREDKAGKALWGKAYDGPPHVVFGHNAATDPQLHPWATGLDTGCVYGGRLTALVLEDDQVVPRDVRARRRRLVSVPARRAYFTGAPTAGPRVA
jgi:hypothetical protein